jgi:hypothetical protein
MVAVPREDSLAEGTPLAAEEGVDARSQAIRQHDLVIRVDSAKSEPLSEQGAAVVFNVKIANHGDETVTVQPFTRDRHPPTLTDNAGTPYTFVESRFRAVGKAGARVFRPATESEELVVNWRKEYYLVFKPAPPSGRPLTLELPAAAWGRKGVCRFQVPAQFEAPPPPLKKQ